LLPTLLGGAATFFSGGAITPFMAALGVGGLTALTSKDLGKGLMAGLGAYGGSGIAGGLMNFGEAAIGAEAAKGALPSGIDPVGADAGAYEMGQAAAAKTARAGASNFDRLSRGVTEGFKNPMGAFSSIGGGSKLQGAAMIGAPLLSALSSQDQTSVPTPEQIKFDPSYANINITREQLPYQRDTGSSAQRGYFGPTYINRNAADGGFVSDDGIEHFGAGGRTRRDSTGTPIIRTPADLVNLGNRGSRRFTPVKPPNSGGDIGHFGIDEYGRRSGDPDFGKPSTTLPKMSDGRGYQDPIKTQVEKPVVQQPIQPAPQQPIQPVTQRPMEPIAPTQQTQPVIPIPQRPMEPTQPTQRRIDETGMVPRQVVENPVIVPRLEGGRDSAARGGLMALAPGGYIDPDYDYSGYGRKKTDVVRPVTPMPDTPKPDFLAADGKTYRYDPIKRSWYVIKEAETKTNPGVETLMGGSPAGGENQPNTTPDYRTAATIGRTLSNMGLTSLGGYLSQQAQNGLTGQTIEGLNKDPKTGLSPGELGGRNPDTGPVGPSTTAGNYANPGDVTAGAQAARDAATSASSHTATGGIANSPSGGLADLAEATATFSGPAAVDGLTRDQRDAIAAALASTTGVSLAAPTVTAGGMYVDAKNAAAEASFFNQS
jgi:hypothetical protein